VLRYPAITLELDLSARFVDLIGENFDVAIRPGPLRDDASLAARRIGLLGSSLYAAPAYLARRGAPPEPEALMEHDTLRLLARTGDPVPWVVTRGEQRWEGVPPGRAAANSPELLMRMAIEGVGITVIPEFFALPYLQRGELIQVLPDWRVPPASVWAVFPGRRLMPARTSAFLDALAARLPEPECQDSEAKVQQTKAQLAQAQLHQASVLGGRLT
jgi:DNA-binding transcriptional LysR family regulator